MLIKGACTCMCHVVVLRTRKLDEEEEAKIPWTQIIKLMSKKIYAYDGHGHTSRRSRLSSLLTPSATYVLMVHMRVRAGRRHPSGDHLSLCSAPIESCHHVGEDATQDGPAVCRFEAPHPLQQYPLPRSATVDPSTTQPVRRVYATTHWHWWGCTTTAMATARASTRPASTRKKKDNK